MNKHNILVVLTCLLIVFATVLTACGGGGDDNGAETTKRPKKTTEKTEATTAATTAPMVTANNLVAQINKSDVNNVLCRLTEGVEIEIFDGDPTYDGVTIELNYIGWPTICKGDGNTLYAVGSARLEHVDPFGTTIFMESQDGGVTWSKPRVIVNTAHDDRDAGIVYMGNGRMLVSYFTVDIQGYIDGENSYWRNRPNVSEEQENALLARWATMSKAQMQGGSYVVYSDDYGQTWGEPVQVPVSAPHGPTLGADGKTLYYFGHPEHPGAAGFSFDETKLHLIYSTNYGQEWRHLSQVDKPTGISSYEPHVIQLTDGSFVIAVRSDTNPADESGNRGMSVFTATSKDGRTWTPLRRVAQDMFGGPPHLLQLKNGVVVLTYGYRLNPCGNRVRLSYDGGKTWGKEIVLCASVTPQSSDMGYPSTIELDDGTLITAYYQPYSQADKNANGKGELFCSFLYTRWTLVEAG
ncbi:MAG: exo-alpha-sialidase [Clostridia bacterium]|nr:exo-alpha-sialidase [Clostridia bacterium]